MHRTILAAAAALGLAAAASADQPERWIYAGMSGGAMGWEAGSVRRDAAAGTASTTRFIYYAKPRVAARGDFSWALQDIEFDCRANTFRLIEGGLFNERRGGVGDEMASDKPIPVRSNTPEAVLKLVLCDNLVVTEALQAASMPDAMDGAVKVALP
jgi:hypothetical protein